jgi:P-type conjugative transfer protein TrbJ
MTTRASLSPRLARAPALALLAATTTALPPFAPPARAQMAVFDPTNYGQNLLSAARALEQINNQIQSLQNEATMLRDMAKNLSKVDFAEVREVEQALTQIDGLMARAQDIDFDSAKIEAQFKKLFPGKPGQAPAATRVAAAASRLDAARDALRHTLEVQAGVVGAVQADARTLSAIVARSQGAEGGLQAAQATNQLLALAAKQQFQLQDMLAAQNRADAIERARRLQGEADARAMTARFLGSRPASRPPR